jgi:hypothetical protein
MGTLLRLLRGVDVDPRITAALRGLIEAVAMGGLVAAAVWVNENIVVGLPVALFVIRWLEGEADRIDGARRRQP